MSLTKIECDRAVCPPGKIHVRLGDGHGICMEVTAAGGKQCRMFYRCMGQGKRPERGALSRSVVKKRSVQAFVADLGAE